MSGRRQAGQARADHRDIYRVLDAHSDHRSADSGPSVNDLAVRPEARTGGDGASTAIDMLEPDLPHIVWWGRAQSDRMEVRMTTKTLAELVPGELPAGIAALPPDVQAELATTVVEARRKQRKDLEGAVMSLLDFVPRFLRGAVKKAAGL